MTTIVAILIIMTNHSVHQWLYHYYSKEEVQYDPKYWLHEEMITMADSRELISEHS